MGDAKSDLQKFVKNNNQGVISLDNFTKASKAEELAMKGLAIAGNMLAVYLASKIITSLYELSQVSKEVAASAKELSETFNNNTKDIGNYRTEVEDLQETIGNSSSSIADVTDARKRLMEIQDELIQKYGQEQGSIDAITSALHGNKGAWDDLINLQWQDLSNQFNRSDYINTVANFFSGYKDNIERMKKEYGDYSIDIDFGSIYGNDNRKKAEDLLGKFGKLKTTDQNGIGRVTLSGNATEVYSQLLQIQQLVKDSGYDFGDAFESQLTDWANKVKDVSDQYKEMYNQYVLYDKILQDSDHGYTNTFKEITDAYSDYQNAINDQNSELAQQKSDDLAKYIVSAMDTAIENGDSDVADYFRSMYPEIQDIVDSWNFDIKFNANTDGLKDNLSNIVERLGNPSKESLTGFSMSTASDDQKNAYADFES